MKGRKKHYLEKYLFWMIELWSEYLLQNHMMGIYEEEEEEHEEGERPGEK